MSTRLHRYGIPEIVYTSLSYPALLNDWLITLTLTLINCDTIILEQSAGSKSGAYVDFYLWGVYVCYLPMESRTA